MRVQLADAIEAGPERDARRLGIRRVHGDAHQRAHVRLDALEPLERAGLRTCRRRPDVLRDSVAGASAEAPDSPTRHRMAERWPIEQRVAGLIVLRSTFACLVQSLNIRFALSCSSLRSMALLAASRRIAAIVCAPWHFSPLPTWSLQSLP